MAKFSFLKNIIDLISFKTDDKNNIILEQYKMAIETANRITKQRYEFNRFMIMICTALIAGISTIAYHNINNIYFTLPIAIIGVCICNIWKKQINCFKTMIKIKFDSVKNIEKDNNFILDLYAQEYKKREKYKKYGSFKSFSEQEKMIADIFKFGFILYLVFVALMILFKMVTFFIVSSINIYNLFL